ncbi:hypothetical protein ACFY1S_02110 [Micromonospora sp. NPDC000663]|uniref:hypothetical protein n=1 Tax=Micromonospora sp. NPDC000663 TaxID=3364218 RepID=UPI0036ACC6A6
MVGEGVEEADVVLGAAADKRVEAATHPVGVGDEHVVLVGPGVQAGQFAHRGAGAGIEVQRDDEG